MDHALAVQYLYSTTKVQYCRSSEPYSIILSRPQGTHGFTIHLESFGGNSTGKGDKHAKALFVKALLLHAAVHYGHRNNVFPPHDATFDFTPPLPSAGVYPMHAQHRKGSSETRFGRHAGHPRLLSQGNHGQPPAKLPLCPVVLQLYGRGHYNVRCVARIRAFGVASDPVQPHRRLWV